mgnify:CR=1 FL=1
MLPRNGADVTSVRAAERTGESPSAEKAYTIPIANTAANGHPIDHLNAKEHKVLIPDAIMMTRARPRRSESAPMEKEAIRPAQWNAAVM